MLALLSTPCGGISLMLIDFVVAEGIASAEATKGHENRRMSAVALWKPSGRTHVYWLLPGQNQTNQHISVLKRKPLEKGRDSSLPFQIP